MRRALNGNILSSRFGKDVMQKKIVDQYGRHIKKLRLNLLDACNMRCLYCMPEDQKFSKLNTLLTPHEMRRIVENLITEGIEEVRLTGGEPLLHPQFKDIVLALSELSLKKFALTTNGLLLKEHLHFLKEHGLSSLNISLDSLKENTFKFITKTDRLKTVLSAIEQARLMGFNLKINTVMLKNINFEEIEDFLNFSTTHDLEIRFLELMKIGHAQQYFARHFVSADEAIERIQMNWLLTKTPMPSDSTSFNFQAINKISNDKCKIGFIASESKPFCEGCSRLRLSNKGQLRPCIMISDGPNIKDLKAKDYTQTIRDLVNKKPFERLEGTKFQMNEIGG